MVRFWHAGVWLLSLLATVEKSGTLAKAVDNTIPGVFIVEYADGVVSILRWGATSH